jgi:hypothetical protein
MLGFAGVHGRRDRAQRICGSANEIVKEIMYRQLAGDPSQRKAGIGRNVDVC